MFYYSIVWGSVYNRDMKQRGMLRADVGAHELLDAMHIN